MTPTRYHDRMQLLRVRWLLTGLLCVLVTPATRAQSTDGEALVAVIRSGNLKVLESRLRSGADPNALSSSHRCTPLEAAAEINAVDAIDLLVRYGADPNRASAFGWTPLMFAVSAGKLEALQRLLASGANANSRSVHGTALSEAVEKRKVSMVEALLSAGADVPTDFTSPLLSAVNQHDLAIVRALLRFGATPNVALPQRSSPLALAIEHSDDEIARVLLESGANANSKSWDGFAAVFLASRMGKKDLTRLLIRKGAKRRPMWQGALLRGAETGDVNAIRDALDRGISAETPDRTTQTALAIAASNGRRAVAELLIRRGARVNHVDREHTTALMEAAAADSPEIIKLLLRHHASIDTQDYLGKTALIRASETDAANAVQALLGAYADANLSSQGGALSDVGESGVGTALHVALQEAHNTIVRLLLQAGAEPITGEPWYEPSAIDVAIKADNRDGLQMIVAACPSLLRDSAVKRKVDLALHSRETTGGSPLQPTPPEQKTKEHFIDPFVKVVRSQSIQSIEEALPRYRDRINEVNSQGYSALYASIEIGLPQIVDLLIRNGADVQWARGNFTVLELAIGRARPGRSDDDGDGDLLRRMEIIRLLLDAGASTAVPAPQSLLHDAQSAGVMKLLIEHGVPLAKGDLNRMLVHKVSYWGDSGPLEFLIAAGADVNFNNGEPLSTAISTGNLLTVKTLLRLGADPNRGSSLRDAMSSKIVLDLLIAAGARVDAPRQDHQEGLVVLATRYGGEVLPTLLHAKVDLNARGAGGYGALHVAVERKDRGIVEALLRAGADPNIRNDEGETPLIQAAMDGAIDLVELFLSHGADRSLRDRKGRNASDWARVNHYDSTVRVLAAPRQ
jgi:ankyrin repeat protein